MIKTTELKSSAIKGHKYLVPCIRIVDLLEKIYGYNEDVYRYNDWIPILLQGHQDTIGNNKTALHYHLDNRFLTQSQKRKFGDGSSIAILESASSPIQWMTKECYRDIQQPEIVVNAFQESCKNKKMRNWKCPHQGFDLRCVQHNGKEVVCPMHGLRWNIDDGRLIK